MKVSVLGTGDAGAWDAALERLGGDADAYDLVGYHRAAEANGDGEACAFVVETDDELFLHPFLRRPIERVGGEAVEGGWCDLESVYGYGGPLATTDDAELLERCWRAFRAWCDEARVVAEFVRFNPLRRNERLAPADAELAVDRETVALPLDGDLWAAYPSVQRNMVRKAQAAGLKALEAPVGERMAAFRELYAATMERVGAPAGYLFTDAYFDALAALGERLRLFEARRDGELAAAALFLVHGGRMHYHLAGARAELRGLAPNNLLLHAAADWGREHGLTVLHLGGGRTAAPDDSLLRFKSGLSRVRLPFYTGRRVHHPRMYDALCSSWLRQARPQARPPYFLLYRLPVAA